MDNLDLINELKIVLNFLKNHSVEELEEKLKNVKHLEELMRKILENYHVPENNQSSTNSD
jgi:hypothetical protein